MTVQSVAIPADSRPEVTIAFADAQGNPVDFLTELAAGAWGTRGPRFVLSEVTAAGDFNSLYEGSTGRPSSFPATAPIATIAAMWTEVSEGVFRFKYPTAIPATVTVTPAATHTVGVWASRVFDGVSYPQTVTFDFVPAGGTPVARVMNVADDACNACHDTLQFHGTRRTVKMCAACHYPGWGDSGTGATATVGADADFSTMVHKLHANVFTWGDEAFHVVMPLPNSAQNCVACHGANDVWKTSPSKLACGSCHTSADAVAHLAGFTDDSSCAGCHGSGTSTSGVSRSIPIVHSALWDAATNTRFVGNGANGPTTIDIVINSVSTTNPAASTVTFTINVNGTPRDIKASPISQLRFSVGGPSADFGGPGNPNPASSGTNYGYVQTANFNVDSASIVATGTPGQFTVPLPSLAAAANTTVAVGVEAYIAETIGAAVREWPQSPTAMVYSFVGTGTATPRRLVTDNAKCDVCHQGLGFHGGEARKGPDYCAMCHHPNNVNEERSSRLEFAVDATGAVTTTPYVFTPESVSIMNMAHKLHAGSALSVEYVLGADRSLSAAAPIADAVAFTGAFPGDLGDCQNCHRAGTYGLPSAANLGTLVATYACLEDPAADADNFCATLNRWPQTNVAGTYTVVAQDRIPPQAAACTGCHDSEAAKAHAAVNTSFTGVESCAVCHGEGATWDALEVHVPAR